MIIFSSSLSFAQTKNPSVPITRILFVLDASNSMLEPYGAEDRMTAAKRILGQFIDSLRNKPNVELALRIYGHQTSSVQNDCNDTKLEVPFGAANTPYIKQVLNNVQPRGVTPIAYSLQQSANDFPVDPTARNIVVLFTDGKESCGADPCAVSLALQKKHVFLKPFIIGLNLDITAIANLECMGSFYNTASADELKAVLSEVVRRVLSATSVQVNLLDVNNKPLETDANMTFYDDFSGISKYNFYHTLNYRGLPDTLSVDPVGDYDLVIHTTPPITREHLQFEDQKVNVISVPASQGFLKIEMNGTLINNNLNNKIKCLVRRAGTYETILIQNLNTTQKLLSGTYDIQVLTLPRMEIKNVEIKQSSTTTVQVPLPGVLNVSRSVPVVGSIFIQEKNSLVKICELGENLSNELIGLQPGNYVIIYRAKNSKNSIDTKEKTITIKGGQATAIKL